MVENKVDDLVVESERSTGAIMKRVDDIKLDNPIPRPINSFSEAITRGVKKVNKLVIKASDSDRKASDKIKDVGKVLGGIPVDKTTLS